MHLYVNVKKSHARSICSFRLSFCALDVFWQNKNQPTLKEFFSQAKTPQPVSKKRPKKLIIRPADVVHIMSDDSDDDGVAKKKKAPRLSDGSFMSWVSDKRTEVVISYV